MNLFKSKKAQGNSLIGITIILLVYGLVWIISYLVLSSFNDYLSTTSYYTSEVAHAVNLFLGVLQILDYLMILLTIVLIIGLGITTYRLATPPIYFIINLIAIPLYGFITYFFSYFFQQFAGQTIFNGVILYFPRTVIVCSNLHWVMLLGFVVGSITLFGKKAKQGQYV